VAGLTGRGRAFLAAGAGTSVSALVLGQRDLLRVGLLLALLPLACALLAGRGGYRLSAERVVQPARLPVGRAAHVQVRVSNLARTPTGVLLAEDAIPYVLGDRSRFVLDRLGGGAHADVGYTVAPPLRGRYELGPLRLRVADPFGMCEVTRSFRSTTTLVVVPATVPLAPMQGEGVWAGPGAPGARSVAVLGEDDVTPREYRYGDDLRRVHWRSTARRGELMVRPEEHPRQRRATVLLDRRRRAHAGRGAASSFEWAVSAAASVVVHLVDQGYAVRLLCDDVETAWTASASGAGAGVDSGTGPAALLDRLAVVEPGDDGVLAGAVGALARGGGDGLVVAVLGDVDADDVTALAGLVRRGGRAVALMLHAPSWAPASAGGRAGEGLGVAGRRARLALSAGGWTTAVAVGGARPDVVWAQAQVALAEPGGRSGTGSAGDGAPAGSTAGRAR
jgi:Protein of unknown function DUF58